VADGIEARQLTREIIEKLTQLVDPQNGQRPVRQVYASSDAYSGPYLDAAPDLVVGYSEGYRVSWGAATGAVSPDLFEDNHKAWSGDHCVDPALVPGVLFANRPVQSNDPGIEDMAPTALSLFGISPPAWMEGKPLLQP
jgi:predicted AlkP superfamily phosphohydrolase/phosphomutase